MIHLGLCQDVLATYPDDHFDAVVTDPPYGIRMSGQKWDYALPSADVWEQVYRTLKPGGYLLSFSSARTYHRATSRIEDAGFEITDPIYWVYANSKPKTGYFDQDKFPGVGGSLKTVTEPITVARKRPRGSITQNIEQYGTGGLNIDECRVPPSTDDDRIAYQNKCASAVGHDSSRTGRVYKTWESPRDNSYHDQGRWPANIVHDGSDAVSSALGNCSRARPVSRYFYAARAHAKDRNYGLPSGQRNEHPTVKPVELMRYLIRLVVPRGGLVLDPFAGSGTTGVAALLEHRNLVLIEADPEYRKLTLARCAGVLSQVIAC